MCQKFTPENLIEQIRLANQQRFGRHTEKLDEIAGQLSFFNEAELRGRPSFHFIQREYCPPSLETAIINAKYANKFVPPI